MENKFDFNKQANEWLLTEILNKQSTDVKRTEIDNFFNANQFIALYNSLQYGQSIEIVKLIVDGLSIPSSDIMIKIVDNARGANMNIVLPRIGNNITLENFNLNKFFTPSGYVDIQYTTPPHYRIVENFYIEYRII